jgi:hypothetical protein
MKSKAGIAKNFGGIFRQKIKLFYLNYLIKNIEIGNT